MQLLATLSSLGRRAVAALIAFTIALLLVIMVAQIVLRYGFNYSLIWAEEACRYLLIWVSFLAAAAAYERGELAAVTMLRDLLPRRAGLVVAIAGNAVALALLVTLVWYGLQYAERIGSQPIPALGFLFDDLFAGAVAAPPIYWVYVALPVGLALLALRMLADMVLYWRMLASGGNAADLRAPGTGEGAS